MSKNQKRKRHPFTPDEDKKLRELVDRYGEQNWSIISCQMANRTVRQCRDRWTNSLCENVIKGEWTAEEDALLLQLFNEQGSRWKSMEKFFPGRAQYDIRNHCKSIVNQKLCAINFFNQRKIISSSLKNKSKFPIQINQKQLSPTHQPISLTVNSFKDQNDYGKVSANDVPATSNSLIKSTNQLAKASSNEKNKNISLTLSNGKTVIDLKNIDPILVPFISEPMLQII